MVEKFRQLYESSFQPELLKEIEEAAILKNLKPKTQLIEIGDYIRSMPFVLNGSIKTMRKDKEGRELLLYFINPGETCAMTLTCCLGHTKSEIKAVAETEVEMLVVPIQKMEEWASHYKTWRTFVFKSYHNQLMRALGTIDDIAFSRLDERLLKYLKEKQYILGSDSLKITHKEIARDLNSSRVVISRLLKKLENKDAIEINHNCIQIKSL